MEKLKLRKKKMIRNKKAFIFLLILCLGVGFAFLSTQLNITGNTSVSGNKWSVYFNNVQVSEGSVDASVVPTTSGTTTTSIEYTVNLDKPGDYYEFTVDAVNAGTIDAMIDSITMTSLDTDVAKYLSYTATYSDGTALAQNDVLKATKTATYKVRVEYKNNISATDLDEDGVELTLIFGVNYVQSAIKPVISEFAKLVKNSALSDSSMDFTQISSETNGRGLYVMNSTTKDDYPIYYYRGNVSNNNAKFAGFCWKVVRTTETGGTKLIYNGTPNASGECTNTTEEETQISTSAFNTSYTSPAYSGYMYGTAYEKQEGSSSTSDVYGNTFTYADGNYTLMETHNGIDNTHHYTCFNTTGICTSVYYVYNNPEWNTSIVYYVTLSGGKSIEDAIVEMQTNSYNSSVKTAVDNWFNSTFTTYFTNNNKDYRNYLEDTIWCNDRSMNTFGVDDSFINNGWKPNGGNTSTYIYYSSFGKREYGIPDLTCSNKNDSFTVVETEKGNGALNYPVGLLTSDEIMLAGGQNTGNSDYYLNNNQYWWSMSPARFHEMYAYEFIVSGSGRLDNDYLPIEIGVRPSISIAPSVKIRAGGDGSSTSPYEFVVE